MESAQCDVPQGPINDLKFCFFCFLILYITYTGLLIDRGKKSNFTGFVGKKSRKNRPISREFRGNFGGKLGRKAIGKKTGDFVIIFRVNFARNRSVLR